MKFEESSSFAGLKPAKLFGQSIKAENTNFGQLTLKPKEKVTLKEKIEILEAITAGLKSLSNGLDIIARKVDDIAQAIEHSDREQQQDDTETVIEPQQEPLAEQIKAEVIAEPAKKTRKKSRKRKMKKPAKSDKGWRPTGIVIYQAVASGAETGINVNEIIETTGLNRKQVSNALHRLKAQGKITNISKGVYVVVD